MRRDWFMDEESKTVTLGSVKELQKFIFSHKSDFFIIYPGLIIGRQFYGELFKRNRYTLISEGFLMNSQKRISLLILLILMSLFFCLLFSPPDPKIVSTTEPNIIQPIGKFSINLNYHTTGDFTVGRKIQITSFLLLENISSSYNWTNFELELVDDKWIFRFITDRFVIEPRPLLEQIVLSVRKLVTNYIERQLISRVIFFIVPLGVTAILTFTRWKY